MTGRARGKLSIEAIVLIWQEGDHFIAHAMPLDVMSAGASPEEARRALDEAVHLFLQTASEAGTLAEVLQEAGYEYVRGKWVSPYWVSTERYSTEVVA